MIKHFTSVKEAMESMPRCILLFSPERLWAATDIEGASYENLVWCETPREAVQLALLTDAGVTMNRSELDLTNEVYQRGEHWACEWWHGADGQQAGEWLRPMLVPQRTIDP